MNKNIPYSNTRTTKTIKQIVKKTTPKTQIPCSTQVFTKKATKIAINLTLEKRTEIYIKESNEDKKDFKIGNKTNSSVSHTF